MLMMMMVRKRMMMMMREKLPVHGCHTIGDGQMFTCHRAAKKNGKSLVGRPGIAVTLEQAVRHAKRTRTYGMANRWYLHLHLSQDVSANPQNLALIALMTTVIPVIATVGITERTHPSTNH